MTLNPLANFPSTRSYVLKLHRDARPETGQLRGRLEHILTGEHFEFASGDELLAWIARHAAIVDALSDPDRDPGASDVG